MSLSKDGNASYVGIQNQISTSYLPFIQASAIETNSMVSSTLTTQSSPLIGTTIIGQIPDYILSQPFPSQNTTIPLVDASQNAILLSADQTIYLMNIIACRNGWNVGLGGSLPTLSIGIGTSGIDIPVFSSSILNSGVNPFMTTFSILNQAQISLYMANVPSGPKMAELNQVILDGTDPSDSYLAIKQFATVTPGTNPCVGQFYVYLTIGQF
jgi:hypothetical protein